jgi:topoisomerase-4 subunit A
MREMARGRGVIMMGLEKNEKLVAVTVTGDRSVMVEGIGRGGKEKQLPLAGAKLGHHVGHRARMGRVLPEKLTPTGLKLPKKPGEVTQ